ncbi:hypothetical protein F8M41_002798 [Gigaspora margarita]|uniref:Protein kinase domain-containing protein n=1 Tax=Gigaspora margarita TaxID=4874 RepID=A0A8H4A6R3_GIGMA|nr:hypothetical protein F8M41_002798 [Gigaspora margarita]
MNKCLDAKPRNRLTVEELANMLGQFFDPEDDNYRIVMKYAKQESFKKLLDSKYSEFSKVTTLYYIADGLNTIHEAQRFLFLQYS